MINQKKPFTVYTSSELDEGVFVTLDYSSTDGIAAATICSENASADAVTICASNNSYVTVLPINTAGEVFTVKCGGTISAGDKLECDGNGEAVSYDDGIANAIATEAGSDGQLIKAVTFNKSSNLYSGSFVLGTDTTTVVVENGLVVSNS